MLSIKKNICIFKPKTTSPKPLKYFPAEQSCCTAWQSAAKSTLCYVQQCVKGTTKSFDAKAIKSFLLLLLLVVLLMEAVNTDLISAVWLFYNSFLSKSIDLWFDTFGWSRHSPNAEISLWFAVVHHFVSDSFRQRLSLHCCSKCHRWKECAARMPVKTPFKEK